MQHNLPSELGFLARQWWRNNCLFCLAVDPSRAYILHLLWEYLKITEHPQGFKACQHIDCKYFLRLLQLCDEQGIRGKLTKVYDQNFYGEGAGVVDEEGGSSERCLKWGCGGQGVIKDLSKNILKQGVCKCKSCS